MAPDPQNIVSLTPIRVVAIMEATSVTGPAKNLIEFATRAAEGRAGQAPVILSIITYDRSAGAAPNPFISTARQAGLQVETIPERFAFDPAILSRLRSAVGSQDPDIIQTHSVKSHFLVRLLGLHRRYPWVAFHHGYTWRDLKNQLYNQLDRWSLRAARQVVTVCRPFEADLRHLGVRPERITIRHNMVTPFVAATPEAVAELRRSLGVAPDQLVAFTAGRLSREKGHADLLDAVARIPAELRQRLRLVIAGEGPENVRLAQQAQTLGIAASVRLVGHQRDLSPFYSLADLVVLPSHSEGSPNVLLEAMSAGLPVVATDVGGIPEIARDGETAILVRSGDVSALADAMTRLLNDGDLRLRFGAAARGVACHYDPDSYCASLVQLYQRVLS